MAASGLIRRQMVRAASFMLLMALGAALYPILDWSDQSSSPLGRWPMISFTALQTDSAVLSAESTAPPQERPTASLIVAKYATAEEWFAAPSQPASLLQGDAIAQATSAVDELTVEVSKFESIYVSEQEVADNGVQRFVQEANDKGIDELVYQPGEDRTSGRDNAKQLVTPNQREAETQGEDAVEPQKTDGLEMASANRMKVVPLVASANRMKVDKEATTLETGSFERADNVLSFDQASTVEAEIPGSVDKILSFEQVRKVEEQQHLLDAPLSANMSQQDPAQPMAASAEKLPEWRSIVDNQLREAKLAIEDPSDSVERSDPLYWPVYHNVTLFRKSYELMEKTFKIFVYKEGARPLVHTGPLTGIYASEGQFIDRVTRGSKFVTKNPMKAHMYFLPYSVAQMVTHLYVPDSHNMRPLATFIKDYVDDLAVKYPYWNLTDGRDHFFVACHDWGPATARDHPTLRHNAVKVVCNADLTEGFVPDKDVSLPEVYIHKRRKGSDPKLGGNRPSHRPYLAFFAGQMHGRVRPVLLEHWKDKDPDLRIYEVLPRAIAQKVSYVQHMKSSKFCICAMGYEVNSPRLVEAISYDCVPVIIADNFSLPFGDVLDWSAFSITVNEKDIPNLKQILLEITDKQYRTLQSRLQHIRQHFLWHPKSPERYDAFHMILHSVWMRRLRQS